MNRKFSHVLVATIPCDKCCESGEYAKGYEPPADIIVTIKRKNIYVCRECAEKWFDYQP